MIDGLEISDKGQTTGVFRLDLVCACVVGFAFSANYTNHAPLVPALTRVFGFSLALAGFLTTGIFLTHAGMQIPGGHMADRLGARRVVTVALAQVCLGNFAIALASSYWQLLFWKIFVGLGTGTCFVAGARYVSAAYSGTRSHLAQGYYGGSILLGSGFVIFAVPRFASTFGWRGGFVITAAAATAAWVFWVIAAPESRESHHPPSSFGGLIANPQLWLLGLAQMASFGLVLVVSSWITTFLHCELQIDPVHAGVLGSIALMLGIVMRPLGGILVRIIGVRHLLRFSLLLSAAGCFLLAFAGNSVIWTALAIVCIGVGCGCPYAALFTSAAALYPGRAGAAMGLVNMLGIAMILSAPPVIGRLVDWSGSFKSSFVALGGFALLALAGTFGIHES
jgi:nitrate/nitrite transporter NarK